MGGGEAQSITMETMKNNEKLLKKMKINERKKPIKKLTKINENPTDIRNICVYIHRPTPVTSNIHLVGQIYPIDEFKRGRAGVDRVFLNLHHTYSLTSSRMFLLSVGYAMGVTVVLY